MGCEEISELIFETTVALAKDGQVNNMGEATDFWKANLPGIDKADVRQVVSKAIVDVINDRKKTRRKKEMDALTLILKEANVEEGLRERLEAAIAQLAGLPPDAPIPKRTAKILNDTIKFLRNELFDVKEETRIKKRHERAIDRLKNKIESVQKKIVTVLGGAADCKGGQARQKRNHRDAETEGRAC